MGQYEKLIADIYQAIKNITSRSHPIPDRNYHKHEEYLSYGLTASEFRQMLKEFRPRILKLSLQEKMDLATQFIQEPAGELGHVGLLIIIGTFLAALSLIHTLGN